MRLTIEIFYISMINYKDTIFLWYSCIIYCLNSYGKNCKPYRLYKKDRNVLNHHLFIWNKVYFDGNTPTMWSSAHDRCWSNVYDSGILDVVDFFSRLCGIKKTGRC